MAMEFRNFDQVVSFMERFMNLERRTDKYSNRTYRLDRMKALMEHLGNPQESYRTIHVAGSKGKGSTASYIARGLSALGYVTGLYLSPHVSDYRERFTLSGSFVPDSVLISVGNELSSSLSDFRFRDDLGDSDPTTFELYTAFAFLLFRRLGCQWAVIETGLGGRLDATNIIVPEASVITPIELEHTEILGDTIALIAGEKSKIIKSGRPSFSAFQVDSALSVLLAEASAVSSPFHYLGDYVVSVTDDHVAFTDGYETDLDLAMPGLVQAQNCALALLVLRSLGLFRAGVTEKSLFANTLPGRMELVPWERPLYLDGAHTPNSMDSLLKTFRKIHPVGGICIFGSVSGKNHSAMAAMILSAFDTIVVSRPGTYKKSDIGALYALLISMKKPSQTVVLLEDAPSALSYCLSHTSAGEPVLATGSFYLAGAIKEALCR